MDKSMKKHLKLFSIKLRVKSERLPVIKFFMSCVVTYIWFQEGVGNDLTKHKSVC